MGRDVIRDAFSAAYRTDAVDEGDDLDPHVGERYARFSAGHPKR
jgi:hypothetical protein